MVRLDSTVTEDNAIATLYALLKGLNAKVTRATVRDELFTHPDFPSLLSLSDLLTSWRIENTALQLNTAEQLRELPVPFIAHLNGNNGWYVLVTELSGNRITYTDSHAGRQTKPIDEFEKSWSGVVLLAEANEQSGETDYAQNRPKEIRENLRGPFLLAGTLLIVLVVILSVGRDLTATDWLLLFTKTTGLILSGLLLAKHLGSRNALTDRLCQFNSKTNCDSVLNSPGAKLWGWLSWADVGLLYFAGGLLCVLLIAVESSIRPLLYWLALLALPYTIYSVYYQARVVRQWCTLCLAVQAVLVVEGILAATQLTALPGSWHPYMTLITAFLLPVLIWVLVKSFLQSQAEIWQGHTELMRLKRDPNLFQTLLFHQLLMPSIPHDLYPIELGNLEAEHTITMVTNPFCEPCKSVHEKLEQLISNNTSIKLDIIFACNVTDKPVKQFASHLIALSREQSPGHVLSNWYKSDQKEYDIWSAAQPVQYNHSVFDTIANRHGSWCEEANIDRTPMLFVNGYPLPSLYRFNTLRWLINYLPATEPTMDLAKSR